MREPRPKQLFPTGGKNLYELLRSDYEPGTIDIFLEDECNEGRAEQEATLTYRRNFDPMLYFWPVEGQHVHAHFDARPADLERLVKALQRDGAAWIVAAYKNDNWTGWVTNCDDSPYIWEQWGDSDGFMRRCYGPAPMDAVAVPGRGGGADSRGAETVPAHPGGFPDRER